MDPRRLINRRSRSWSFPLSDSRTYLTIGNALTDHDYITTIALAQFRFGCEAMNSLHRTLLLCGLSVLVVESVTEYCDNGTGKCASLTSADCPVIFYNWHLIGDRVKYCDESRDIVCCPLPKHSQNQLSVSTANRISARECRRYSEIWRTCASTPFIVNGTKAAPKEYPFMALIGTRNRNSSNIRWDCGGTLIHPKYILTAAHCLESTETKSERLDPAFDSPKFVVRLGELDYSSTIDDARPEDFEIVNYVVHPSYNDGEDGAPLNDIALIELNRRVTFSEYIAPACLSSSPGNEHQQLTAVGWGHTRYAGTPSTHLRRVTLERFSDEQCHERVSQTIEPRTQFCAGSRTSSADTCNGDSGGPIFVQHPEFNCLKQIIGITSYGQVCGTRNVPSVYTKIYLYIDWIENVVWGTEK
ncbi:serine protease snake [Scaptodrosophila lebanonensis]|uniref:Serine protease snake n=1 Tax=Drosophila lebanonensis TaxID=7225 RepID=A0A6J2TN59_DROLE|nr:serine protease snake [Scaptodrosophila lebanonensis]